MQMANCSRASLSRPTPLHLAPFLPYACAQLGAPFTVQVVQTVQDDYVNKFGEKYKKVGRGKSDVLHSSQASSATRRAARALLEESDASAAGSVCGKPDAVVVTAVCDTAGRLTELTFVKCNKVPRLLAQIIGICIPYQTFLNRITVRWVPLDGDTIYEIGKFLPLSSITDVTLDDAPAPAPERNYHVLLARPQLKRLSLARCNVGDDGCVRIASMLVHPQPAATRLLTLSLVSNDISDVGAIALGEALRSNRSLQYLNLSGNKISDTGATAILRTLMEFYVTNAELIMKRQRLMSYLKLKSKVVSNCLNELIASKEKCSDEFSKSSKRKTAARGKGSGAAAALGFGVSCVDTLLYKAEAMTNDLIGTYMDPFSIEETELQGDSLYCLGNFILCYLNVSYNRLGYSSLKVLVEVLKYQSSKESGSGLLRVIFEGNNMPVACPEYAFIDEILNKAVSCRIAKTARKPDRVKSKIK